MKVCPITYHEISKDKSYSQSGLHLLSPKLTQLQALNFSAAELRAEAIAIAGKMSLQGVQPKLSAQLKIKEGAFEIVDRNGHYILKPQSEHYPQLPENEAITMTLAETIGLEVPIHGLVYSNDGSMTYFIKRFDRIGHTDKLAVEDFAQLSLSSRETKYNSSMERIAKILNFCSFPRIEAVKLFKLTLFNFLVGNEDMHLKNFSVITRKGITTLSPSYDLLNTSIAVKNPSEELALPLNGKKNNLRRKDFFEYYAKEQLLLNDNVIKNIVKEFNFSLPSWQALISRSFLTDDMKKKYLQLLHDRCERVKLIQDIGF